MKKYDLLGFGFIFMLSQLPVLPLPPASSAQPATSRRILQHEAGPPQGFLLLKGSYSSPLPLVEGQTLGSELLLWLVSKLFIVLRSFIQAHLLRFCWVLVAIMSNSLSVRYLS